MRCGQSSLPAGCECVPAGVEVGEVLIWDGTAWVPSSSGLLPGAMPWSAGWGTPNFGGQALFYMQNVNWTGAVFTPASRPANVMNTSWIFPKEGGVLRYISAEIIGATVAPSQPTTYTALVDGVASLLAVTLAAALNASDSTYVDVVLPPKATNYRIELEVTAASNPGSGATIPNRAYIGGYANPP
jgi:hypothetical protein